MQIPKLYLLCALVVCLAAIVPAQQAQTIEYQDGDKTLEGLLVVPDDADGPRPAVMVVHQWMGITEHERDVAERLAEEGYIAFAADIYGKGDRPSERSEAGKYAGMYRGNIPLYRQRLQASLETLKARPEVDPDNVAVIGYCFGGTGALEAARMGADIKAAVSLHGGLGTPDPADAQNIKCTVLVLHGAQDRAVDDDEMLGFINEMRAAEVDWYMMIFSDAVHGFTHRHDPDRYNEKAEERSWEAMMDLFEDKLD